MGSLFRFGVGLSVLLVACGACGGGGGGQPDAAVPDGGTTGLLGFTPSNVDPTKLDFSNVGDLLISSDKTWETDLGGTLGSDNAGAYHYQEITQSNGVKLGVFTVRSITIQAGVTVGVEGADALVVVALASIDVQGMLDGGTHASPFRLGPGAALDDKDGNVAGLGMGGGGAGTGDTSGGGGGFCGTGGAGAALTGTPAQGGASYGAPSLTPLVAGSMGGSGEGIGGAGGGAIQLVAAKTISVGGTIHVGGEGGANGGVYNPPSSQEAGGAGSGGAILLESGTVTITGTLAANGGGGGQGDGVRGADGSAHATAAPGGNDGSHGSPGGAGAAATTVDGQAGSVDPASTAGGGGGAVGRIRINTLSGAATISGTLSPAASTPCATQGTVAP